MDKVAESALKKAIKWLLESLPTDKEVRKNTPTRVLKSYRELLKGYEMNPKEILKQFTMPGKSVNVMECCEFYSLCEHHMLPFYGKVYIAYTTSNKVFGLSKLARLVEVYSRRLQIQEEMTYQIAKTLYDAINPNGKAAFGNGVFVVVVAKHLCMSMRGIQKQDAETITKKAFGLFITDNQLRTEFMTVLRSKKVKI